MPMAECEHPTDQIETVIDRLGPMRNVRRGGRLEAEAQVIEYHQHCRACGATIPKESTP